MSAFLYFFNNVFFLGEQQVLASDQAVLSIKARMKIIKNVSVSYDDHFIGNPFKVEAKGMKLENLIKVKISYNGYRPIKLILKQKKQSDSDAENFAFYHEQEKVKKKINYSIYFSKTKLPLIDGVIFSMDNNTVNPIIDEQIGLDLYIHSFKKENCVAGKYATSLQLIIMEVE